MERIIKSYQEALDVVLDLAPKRTAGWHFLYRGHASTDFKLLSMVGRKKPLNKSLLDSEQQCFNDFKDLVKDENWLQFKMSSYNENMYYLSIGRHLGLDCRLLDWTASFKTALYLASSDKSHIGEDGHLWVMAYPYNIDDAGAKLDPFSINKLNLIKENFWSKEDIPINEQPLAIARRFSQHGFFTITPSIHLTTPLNEIDTSPIQFVQYRITVSAKEDIINQLQGYDAILRLSSTINLEKGIKVINARYFKQ